MHKQWLDPSNEHLQRAAILTQRNHNNHTIIIKFPQQILFFNRFSLTQLKL